MREARVGPQQYTVEGSEGSAGRRLKKRQKKRCVIWSVLLREAPSGIWIEENFCLLDDTKGCRQICTGTFIYSKVQAFSSFFFNIKETFMIKSE